MEFASGVIYLVQVYKYISIYVTYLVVQDNEKLYTWLCVIRFIPGARQREVLEEHFMVIIWLTTHWSDVDFQKGIMFSQRDPANA